MTEFLEHESRIAGQTASSKSSEGLPELSAPASETQPEKPVAVQAMQDGLLDLSGDEGAEMPQAVKDLIKRCMDGTEPPERPLHSNEARQFSTQHVNICMLKVAGFRTGEIASACGYTPTMVSVTIHHPYGRKIIHALMTARGTRVLDIRSRLDEYAGEVLDHMYGLAVASQDLKEVSNVTFGLLDRAGYSTTHKITQVPASQLASENALARVASALEQSASVDSHIMQSYVPSSPPDEGRGGVDSERSGARDQMMPGQEIEPLSGGIRLTKVAG